MINHILSALIIVVVKSIVYTIIIRLAPMDGLERISSLRAMILLLIAWLTVFVKESQVPLMRDTDLLHQLSLFMILLHVSLLFLLVLLENYQRQMQEYMSVRFQVLKDQALLKNIQLKQDNAETIRNLRHDLKNHLLTIRLLIEKGNISSATTYIDEFLNQASPSSLSICTGHDLMDGLLQEKLGKAQKQNVSINVVLNFRQGTFIKDFDLCSIMGNVLDNAVEAVCQVKDQNARFIDIHGGCQANCMIIHISNSFETAPEIVDDLPRTLKPDKQNHGYGLRNVKRILEKYNGNLTVTVERSNCFTLVLLIPIPEKE